MSGDFSNRMMPVLPQVGSDDEEDHDPEKESPVATIQAASGLERSTR
jgi:hypothetical protein